MDWRKKLIQLEFWENSAGDRFDFIRTLFTLLFYGYKPIERRIGWKEHARKNKKTRYEKQFFPVHHDIKSALQTHVCLDLDKYRRV